MAKLIASLLVVMFYLSLASAAGKHINNYLYSSFATTYNISDDKFVTNIFFYR